MRNVHGPPPHREPMRPALLLGWALASSALAVGLVAADLAWTLTVALESQGADGAWSLVTQRPEKGRSVAPYHYPTGCAQPNLRLVVDNHRPIPAHVSVEAWYANATRSRIDVVLEEWTLTAYEVRVRDFALPASAFEATTPSGEEVKPARPGTTLWVLVGDLEINACVEREA